jgi:Tfp pilus assembly protein PilN
VRAVNLLPEAQRRQPPLRAARRPLAALAILGALGGMGYWGYSVNSDIAGVRDQVEVATAARDRLQSDLAAYQAADQRFESGRLRRGAVIALASGRVNWERLIRDVSAVIPRTVWLVALNADLDEGAPGAAAAVADPNTVPRGLHLDGYARSHAQVATTMARVAAVKGLGEPRLTSSLVEQVGGVDVFHFLIDVPVDLRAQDRPTLIPTSASADTSAVTTP